MYAQVTIINHYYSRRKFVTIYEFNQYSIKISKCAVGLTVKGKYPIPQKAYLRIEFYIYIYITKSALSLCSVNFI